MRIAGVQKELVAIAGFFKSYEEGQRQRNGTLLNKGLAFYEKMLKLNGTKIMKAIEEEIETVKQMADEIKEKKVKEKQMQILPMIDELLKLRFINETITQRQEMRDQELRDKIWDQIFIKDKIN